MVAAEWYSLTATVAGRMPPTSRAGLLDTGGEPLLPMVLHKIVRYRNASHAAAEAVSYAHGAAIKFNSMKGNTMKLLQTALFSLLMGMSIAANSADNEKLVAKCDQLKEDRLAVDDESKEASDLSRITHDYEPRNRLHRKAAAITEKMGKMGCYEAFVRRYKEERGLNPE